MAKVATAVCLLDTAGNATTFGHGVNDVIRTGSFSLQNSVQILGGGLGLTGNFFGAAKGFGKVSSSTGGGFGVLGQITEGTFELGARSKSIIRSELLSMAKSKKFLKRAGLYGKENEAARLKFWELLRNSEVFGSTKGGAAGLLTIGDGIYKLGLAITPNSRYLGMTRNLIQRHELLHFVREAKVLAQGGKSLFQLERSLKLYDPRLYMLMLSEETRVWYRTLKP